MIALLTRLFGGGVLGWAKFTVIAALLSTALYTVHDYRRLSVKVEAQSATIARLNDSIKGYVVLLAGTRATLGELDKECLAAADRYIKNSEILKKIEQSADPLTDAANFEP